VYSTYLGGTGDDYGNAIATDAAGTAYVAGATASPNVPVAHAAQWTYNDVGAGCYSTPCGDAVAVTLSADGRTLRAGTYLGGSAADGATAVAVDCAGNVTLAGYTQSPDFPTAGAAVQGSFASTYGYDAFAARLGATRAITYSYDGVDRLTAAGECPGSVYRYGYDPASNRISETVDGALAQLFAYDAANEVTTATTPGGTVAYGYDVAGNLLTDGTRTYSYDALNRLVALAGAGTTEGYGYNGDGVLVTQTVNGVPTAYTQDLAAGQSQVLQTATGTGTPAVTDYLYGLERLASVPSGGSARTWYGTDLQGSVRYTTDDGANINSGTQPTYYDPYGVPETGARPPPPFGYTGELQDGATGLQNLRARTYNPATGQFLTRDPLEQQTGQAYLYASGDPVNNSDPSGACTIFGHEVPLGLSGSSCSAQFAGRVLGGIVDPAGAAPVRPPVTKADVNCLYGQIQRIARLRPDLRRGFVVAPAVLARVAVSIARAGAARLAAGAVVIGSGAAEVGTGVTVAGAVAAGAVVVGVVGVGGYIYYVTTLGYAQGAPGPAPVPAPTPNPAPTPTPAPGPGPTVGPAPAPPGVTATPEPSNLIWRRIKVGNPYNFRPSSADTDGLSGTKSQGWQNDARRWIETVFKRVPEPGEQVVGAPRVALEAGGFTVEDTPVTTGPFQDPYHVSIGRNVIVTDNKGAATYIGNKAERAQLAERLQALFTVPVPL